MHKNSEFLNFLQERGYLYQCTNLHGLNKLLLNNEYIISYIGFDCTARSLHIGSLIQIMILRHLQKLGHKPIVVLGGCTTRIGDPSFRIKKRSILSIEEMQKNISNIKMILENILSCHHEHKVETLIINNADWLDKIKYIDFLLKIGAHFSIKRMLGFESMKTRLDVQHNLSFLEFNYMILQAYDFIELNKRYGCRVQIGGSDQWGNIINGIELGKKLNLPELFGITTPLLLNSQGCKMGKTAGGAIWLDSNMLSPNHYWQYFRNIDDQQVGYFLKLFTDLPLNEIKKLETLKSHEINEAKKILATEVTKICHGDKASEHALYHAVHTFEKQEDILLPTFEINMMQALHGQLLIDLLYITGLTSSKTSAKRVIENHGCKVNDITITDIKYVIHFKCFKKQKSIKLSVGKKNHIIVVIIQ
ncbi:tyrosine--tRNA ligase [Wolbachia endosymbiont of Howardula sp.]|uniref:tyrosine--tRNA ligase n=1 Tax=Wolbachia endosymbiont of Howardula sp. TaxID=2916816 RepID=UPI00217E5DBE|nr:tyrosine--tRNA ligase [Wolbachia endosymbiont of Howardula sp.]UWI83317.1 tyrosine--tRNA ligase [Wolbachia endosymbiont of Howardula sp.]